MSTWPRPLLEAKEALDPLFRAAGYRFVGLEAFGGGKSGTAEYRTAARRLRIVFEGEEDAIWIDSATERDAQIISPWTDIEWTNAGHRLPPIQGSSSDRIATLIDATATYLAG